jgi:hypothetical protein
MYRGPDNPVSWPEVLVIQSLHGEDNVFDAEFARSEPSNIQMERMRLLGLYGKEAVDNVYPGARPAMEMEFPGDKSQAAVKRPERRPIPTSESLQAEETETALPLALSKKPVEA